MTDKEMLLAYRSAVIELQELAVQLDKMTAIGRPRGIQGVRLDAVRGTNDPVAAAMQAADGIEAMIRRKQQELSDLALPVGTMMDRIRNTRMRLVVEGYYLQAGTDASIASTMCMSRARVNQIRNNYLSQIS